MWVVAAAVVDDVDELDEVVEVAFELVLVDVVVALLAVVLSSTSFWLSLLSSAARLSS